MRRDMEFIRKIALALEHAPTGYAPDDLSIEGYTSEQFGYHAYLMIDAGLVEEERIDHMESDGPEAILRSLTWAGHEFADAAGQMDGVKSLLVTFLEAQFVPVSKVKMRAPRAIAFMLHHSRARYASCARGIAHPRCRSDAVGSIHRVWA